MVKNIQFDSLLVYFRYHKFTDNFANNKTVALLLLAVAYKQNIGKSSSSL